MSKSRRELTCAYIFTDGTLAQLFEEYRDGVKIGETADLTYGFCQCDIYPSYSDSNRYHAEGKPVGRIVLHRGADEGFLTLAKGGKIRATAPSLSGGSEKTKEQGIEVQYVCLESKSGIKLHWCEATSILGSSFTVQSGDTHVIDQDLKRGDRFWSDYRVWKVTDLRQKKEVAA